MAGARLFFCVHGGKPPLGLCRGGAPRAFSLASTRLQWRRADARATAEGLRGSLEWVSRGRRCRGGPTAWWLMGGGWARAGALLSGSPRGGDVRGWNPRCGYPRCENPLGGYPLGGGRCGDGGPARAGDRLMDGGGLGGSCEPGHQAGFVVGREGCRCHLVVSGRGRMRLQVRGHRHGRPFGAAWSERRSVGCGAVGLGSRGPDAPAWAVRARDLQARSSATGGCQVVMGVSGGNEVQRHTPPSRRTTDDRRNPQSRNFPEQLTPEKPKHHRQTTPTNRGQAGSDCRQRLKFSATGGCLQERIQKRNFRWRAFYRPHSRMSTGAGHHRPTPIPLSPAGGKTRPRSPAMPDDLPRPLPPDRQNPLFADQRDPVADIAPGKAGWCQTRPPWALPRRGPSAPRRLHHRHHPGPDRVGQSLPALDDEGEVGRKCAAKCAALGADPLFPRGKRRLFESLVAHWPGLRNRHDSRGFRRKPSLHSGFCFSVRFPARPRGNVLRCTIRGRR